jgi:hypothetical protein
MARAVAAYEQANLPLNASKAFDRATTGAFWGIEVDGRKGLVRASSARFWPLVLITIRVLSLGVCTLGLLESMVGSWLSILIVKRRLLCLMDQVYKALHAGGAPGTVLRISDAMRDELFVFCILGTVASVNMRAEVLPQVFCTDASNWGFAAVSADVPPRIAVELMRHALTKPLWTKLLPPAKAWLKAKSLLEAKDELPGAETYDLHPLWELCARALEFVELFRSKHTRQVHINVGELRGFLALERRLCRQYAAFRWLEFLDSQVCLGALVKGRSASPTLNRELARNVPYILGADATSLHCYVSSKLNPADAPTRHAPVPRPDWDKPAWWSSLAQGRFDEFDAWLSTLPLDVVAAPDFSSLGYSKHHLQIFWSEFLDTQPSSRELRDRAFLRSQRLHLPIAACRDLDDRPVFQGRAGEPQSSDENKQAENSEEVVAMLRKFPLQQFYFNGDAPDLSQRGALDLYSGRAGVAKSLVKNGCPWVLSFEWKRSASENLLDPGLQNTLLELIAMKVFKLVGSAMICSSFTRAITPPVRSARFPRGFPSLRGAMRIKVRDGNKHFDFNKKAVFTAEESQVFFWLENPDPSFVWQQKGFEIFRSPASPHVFRTDFCRYGTLWRKRTRLAVNLPSLAGGRIMCTCKKKHLVLRGTCRARRKPWTAVAEPYPSRFSALIAAAAAYDCGWKPLSRTMKQKLDLAACAKAGASRIGEADNPGPRKTASARNFSLEDRPLQTFASIRIGEAQLDDFMKWSTACFRGDPTEIFVLVPLFLSHAVRRYGDLLFNKGGSLMYYRHLVLAAVRAFPAMKQYAHICWDLASRWEKQEPVEHRMPIPRPVLEALVSLAWQMSWRRWACTAAVCFFGAARVGEVVLCLREDLLLPVDLMEESSDVVFLRLRQSKTSYRQKAKVQHLKIECGTVVRLLSQTYGEVDAATPLFPGSASVFRRRWDFLLRALSIPASCKLTPGGLRGGGAVHAFRQGLSIPDLLWKMRIQHAATLEAYLQEVTAITALTQMPDVARQRVMTASTFFPFLS